jgi:hypothetical protein
MKNNSNLQSLSKFLSNDLGFFSKTCRNISKLSCPSSPPLLAKKERKRKNKNKIYLSLFIKIIVNRVKPRKNFGQKILEINQFSVKRVVDQKKSF